MVFWMVSLVIQALWLANNQLLWSVDTGYLDFLGHISASSSESSLDIGLDGGLVVL